MIVFMSGKYKYITKLCASRRDLSELSTLKIWT